MNESEREQAGWRRRVALDGDIACELPPPLERERRLHARAYRHWASLLRDRRCPAIRDLDPRDLVAFAPTSVLVELAREGRAPVIRFLGRELANEAAVITDGPAIGDVPPGSVLGRLFARLPAFDDHRPVELRADHPEAGGSGTVYRGILLPFADETGAVAYVYGVINWRRLAGARIGGDVIAAVDSALAAAPGTPSPSAWGAAPEPAGSPAASLLPLEQRLAAARTWAALAATDRPRRAAHLHAAVSAAHDLANAAADGDVDLAGLAAGEGMAAGTDAALAVRLVFGADASRADRARYGAALAHARRIGIGKGMLRATLDRHRGGLPAFAAAERRARILSRRGLAPETSVASAMWLAPLDKRAFSTGAFERDAAPGAAHVAALPGHRRRRVAGN